jgi:hypothetical protein
MRHFVKQDRGNALIMGALSFAVLAGFGVLTIDIGRILVTHTQLQNAADAGALAGAGLFCQNVNPTDSEVQDRVRLVGGNHMTLAMDTPTKVDIPNSQIFITRSVATQQNIVEVHTLSVTRQYFLNLMKGQGWGGKGGNSDTVSALAAAACGATCGVQCVKPWSIPDRWDDVTPIAGHTGGNKNAGGNWANNNHWDNEDYTDSNGNHVYDLGEPYDDSNANGKYDEEQYNQQLTGFIPDPYPGNFLSPTGDLGLEMTLKANNGSNPQPGQYWAIDLPPINRGNPVPGADEYRDNIAKCNPASVWPGDWLATEPGNMVGPTNQGMRDLIAQDPNAYWDPITQSVQGSQFQVSPRIVLIPIHDPRIPIKSGRPSSLQVVKVAAFFMEQMEGNAEVRGRFLKVRAPGEPCVAGNGGGGGVTSFTYTLSLIR